MRSNVSNTLGSSSGRDKCEPAQVTVFIDQTFKLSQQRFELYATYILRRLIWLLWLRVHS